MSADVAAVNRLRRVPRWSATAFGRAAHQAPLTLALVVIFWVLGAGTASLLAGPHGQLRRDVLLEGRLQLGHPLSLLLSLLWAPNIGSYVWGTVALLGLGIFAEQRLGTARYAIALVASHMVAAATLAALTVMAGSTRSGGAHAFLAVRYGGPVLGVVGAALAASAWLPMLWRRRVRVGSLTLFATMALFDGGGVAVLLIVAALTGLLLGRVMHRAPARPSPVGSVHEARILAAVMVAATAVGPLLATLTPRPAGPFAVLGYLVANIHGVAPAVVVDVCAEHPASLACTMGQLNLHPGLGVTIMSCLPALLLLLAAAGLRRGHRSAWIAALTLEATLAVAAIGDYFLADVGSALPTGAFTDVRPALLLTRLVLPCLVPLTVAVVVLILGRDLFTVRAPAGIYRRLARHVALLALASGGVYVAVGLLVPAQWQSAPTAGALIADFPLRLVPVGLTFGLVPSRLPTGSAARLLFDWIGVAFWAAACLLILRGGRRRPPAIGSQNEPARSILMAHGGSSLGWMTLWPDNEYWFTTTGTTYVAYRVIQGVALTMGDPVGPVSERATAVQDFARFCESAGTVPCFYSATAQLEESCAAAGWSSVQIAEETILPLGSLTFSGRRFQDVRTALNRARREGVRTEWIDYRTADLSTVVQIQSISEEWVAQQSLPEMGFTLGGVDQLDDPQVRCSVAVDEAGLVHAVASWLPIYGEGGIVVGWTLDFMRRRTDGFRNGTELLIAQAALDLQAEGYSVLSLSGAPLARAEELAPSQGHGDTARPDPLERLLDYVGTRLEPVYGFRSLMRFKAKFQPELRPMYLIYADAAALPAIGRAVALAYVPDASLGMALRLFNRLNESHRHGSGGPGAGAPPADQPGHSRVPAQAAPELRSQLPAASRRELAATPR